MDARKKAIGIDEMEDDQLKAAVASLRDDVGRKRTELSAVSATIEEVQSTISQQGRDRRALAGKLLQVEEVTPLISAVRGVRGELEEKWRHLKQLQDRTAQEQRELEDLSRRLEGLRRESQNQDRTEQENKENLAAVRELEGVYDKRKEECHRLQEQLEKAQKEMQSRQSERQARRQKESKSLDQQLDSLILRCCDRAGLALSTSQSTQ